MNFYKCLNCGDVAVKLGTREPLLKCCDERMKKLKPGEVDASLEKHVPVVERKDQLVYVTVGEMLHPMTEEHFIEWIVLETKKGFSIVYLKPDEKPEASFLVEEEPVAVYAYCNLHGLWKTELSKS